MKLKDLIQKIDGKVAVQINGKQYNANIFEEILEAEIIEVNIETKKDVKKDDLESLGYSFEIGV